MWEFVAAQLGWDVVAAIERRGGFDEFDPADRDCIREVVTLVTETSDRLDGMEYADLLGDDVDELPPFRAKLAELIRIGNGAVDGTISPEDARGWWPLVAATMRMGLQVYTKAVDEYATTTAIERLATAMEHRGDDQVH